MEQFHGTTIMSVRRDGKVALGGDGQVTLGQVVVKASARKVRRLYHDRILAGFAGGTADAFTLFELFEAKLDKHQGNLLRSAVEALTRNRLRERPSKIPSPTRRRSFASRFRSPPTCASTPINKSSSKRWTRAARVGGLVESPDILAPGLPPPCLP